MNFSPTHIVWFHTSFIGDLVLASGAMSKAMTMFPNAKHVLISTPIGCSLLKTLNWHGTIEYDKRKLSILSAIFSIRKQLKSLGIAPNTTVLIQPHESTRSHLISLSLKTRRITFDNKWISRIASIVVPRIAVWHECHRVALLLEPLGLARKDIVSIQPSIPLTDDSRRWVDSALQPYKEEKWIALAPGSVWATKQWPKENFLDLIHQIQKETDYGIVLIGSPNEKDTVQYLVDNLPINDPNVSSIVDLSGQTSLPQLNALIQRIDLLIGNDSSPQHFASIHDTPTLSIFGPTTPAMGFGPRAKKHKIMEIKDLPCRPCGAHGPKACPLDHFKCMKTISANSVLQEIKMILERS